MTHVLDHDRLNRGAQLMLAIVGGALLIIGWYRFATLVGLL